jgi:PmbA protein
VRGDAGARYATEAMLAAGADQAQCRWSRADKTELNVEWDEVSLLRTTANCAVNLVAIVDGKRAQVSTNQIRREAIDEAVRQVLSLAAASRPDDAYSIAAEQASDFLERGPATADLDAMYTQLDAFLTHRAAKHPTTIVTGIQLDFTSEHTWLASSTGADLEARTGAYQFAAFFSSRQGADVSSFNYSAATMTELERPLWQLGSIERLLQQSAEQVHTKELPQKFIGDVVITPDCMGSFLGPLAGFLADQPLITGTSIYRDALDTAVADKQLTLSCRPVSDEVVRPRFFTQDGYLSRNTTVIDKGVLKSFLLSQYGAAKTGLERAACDGGQFVVEPGNSALDDLIGSVERGVLLCRFSGGRPSENGDFSGIAKNSYYIEDGKIQYPISETMVSGNLASMLHNVGGVSKERISFGTSVLPWIRFGGMTLSN